MGYTGRTFAQIRDAILAEHAYQYTLAGETLLTARGSDAWRQASATALVLMASEAGAENLESQIFPDTADTANVNRHGNADGIDRAAAVAAELQVNVSGTPLATSLASGLAMTSPTGTRYSVTSVPLLDGLGGGTITVEAEVAGTDGNASVGTILTWVAPPAGFDATGIVAGTITEGEEAEDDDEYAARILSNRRNRAGSGNRQDWRRWVEEVDGVDTAYVYSNAIDPGGGIITTGAAGVLTTVALGPPRNGSVSQTRILSSGKIAQIAAYIEGTLDAAGEAVPAEEQVQLRPTTLPAANCPVRAATQSVLAVVLTLTVNADNAFPFVDGGYTTTGTPTTTGFTVTPAPDTLAAGQRPAVGDLIAVENAVFGGYSLATVATVNPATGAITVAEALEVAPASGAIVLPATPVWADVLTAVGDLFDNQGPGDTDGSPAVPAVASRWPAPEHRNRDTIFRAQISAAALGVTGVVNVGVTTPASDTKAEPFRLNVLGALKIVPV